MKLERNNTFSWDGRPVWRITFGNQKPGSLWIWGPFCYSRKSAIWKWFLNQASFIRIFRRKESKVHHVLDRYLATARRDVFQNEISILLNAGALTLRNQAELDVLCKLIVLNRHAHPNWMFPRLPNERLFEFLRFFSDLCHQEKYDTYYSEHPAITGFCVAEFLGTIVDYDAEKNEKDELSKQSALKGWKLGLTSAIKLILFHEDPCDQKSLIKSISQLRDSKKEPKWEEQDFPRG